MGPGDVESEPASQAAPDNWSRWGADDERGALNLITTDAVRAGAGCVRTGKVYPLALPIDGDSLPIFAGRPPAQRLTWNSPADEDEFVPYGAPPGMGSSEDLLVIPTHLGTHMDALSHVFSEGTIYNGYPASSHRTRAGATRCGIERNGAFAGRAVLLDVDRHTGGLEPGQPIDGALLEECRAAQRCDIGSGDILLVRTGWTERFVADARSAGWSQAGLGLGAVAFIADHEIAAVGADNSSVEAIPFDRGVFMGLHLALLRGLGVTLLEHLWLAELSADRCYEMLLSVGGQPVRGATGSPVNPIAIG